MKKFLLIGLIVAVVLIIVGGAGIVYARVRGIGNVTTSTINTTQGGDKIVQPFGYGPGGMMNGRGITCASKMKDYIISAFANAVGLTADEVNTRLSNGETHKQIAIAQGKTEADLTALATQVRKDALDKAVADGVITQAQADQMLKLMDTNLDNGFRLGFSLNGCLMRNDRSSQNKQP